MVSLIITCYNYGHFIERAVRSALNQSLPSSDYEVIVVNDGSTDETARVLENYGETVRIFNLEKNTGLAAARNFGIKKAKGQFVVFLDADDYIHYDMLKVQKVFLTENNNLDAVAVDYIMVDEKGNHLEVLSSEKKPIACGIMFRKDFLYEVGLYDEKFKAREEEDLRIRFGKKYRIYHIILPLYRYRRHNNNLTNDSGKMKKYKKLLKRKHK